jgi:hypothetical protein
MTSSTRSCWLSVMASYTRSSRVRGVPAAYATGGGFFVFCDRRRPDLIDRWFEVMRAVTDSSLRTRLGILTWQEIAGTLPKLVLIFPDEKYGI